MWARPSKGERRHGREMTDGENLAAEDGMPAFGGGRKRAGPTPAHWMAITIFFGAVVSLKAAEPNEIRVVGSDLLGLEFSKALYAFAADQGLPLALALDGSRPAVEYLRRGRAAIGILTLPIEETFAAPGFETVTLGYHAVVVLAPADCPIDELSVTALRGIFGRSGASAVERWTDLGVTGEWGNSPVVALAPEPGRTIAIEYFRHAVLGGMPMKTNVERYSDVPELLRRFGGEARPIALAAQVPPDLASCKVLGIVARNGVGVKPSAEAVHGEDYPLRLPVEVVFRSEAGDDMHRLLHHLLSDELSKVLERAGIIPVPAEVRARQGAALVER